MAAAAGAVAVGRCWWASCVVLLLVAVVATVAAAPTPVVLMHGINSHAASLDHTSDLIKKYIPGTYVLKLEIGDGAPDSIFMPMREQIGIFCQIVQSDPQLVNGFHLMGVSQGGVLSRGFIEYCDSPRAEGHHSEVFGLKRGREPASF
eukprot:TRINITY_DN1316_c0_g1_i4.p2 TRINITY_DN1316_c0_g1~~TRINITY_DN1316_c0_g1_i4.p2  ORF type:complete len:148 (+),score=19.77 TRINITY_DN1316_c0_g1_i4:15-458(+)